MSNTKAFKVKNGLELGAFSKAISDTAVDVFVYDTRKDSDGGAWRKRTQHTSWYNETLNTATRGSRKEFPSVAVIVLRTNAVTIYDGDDPDLPMWWYGMSSNMGGFGMNGAQAVSMLNGLMIIGQNDTSGSNYDGLRVLDFVRDYGYWTWYNAGGSMYEGTLLSSSGGVTSYTRTGYPFLIKSGNIPTKEINDVAMTVLPNAPIDAATGLPVPTIAVATDGGVSVIKDDGTVVSDSTIDGITPYVGSVAFWNNETLAVQYGYASTDDFTRIRTFSYPAMTEQYQYRASQDYSGFMGAASNWTESLTNKAAIGSEYGLIALHRADDPSEVTAANQMVAQVASSYNTGWMNGEIKLATLSDTDDTDVTGSELVTNGDFSSATGWSVPTGVSISGGVATFSSPSHGSNLQQTATSFVSGKTYTISVEVTAYTSGGITIYANYSSGTSTTVAVSKLRSVGLHSFTWTATGDGTGFSLQADAVSNGACSLTLDNVSVRLAEEDRSVNGNGLQVFGTVTKNPVNSGADLVAYSGFSSSNYLEQPYNSDLDFGTGDFCIMGWNKGTDPDGYLIARNDGSGSTDRIAVDVSSGKYRFYLEAGATGILTSTSDADTNTWTQFCALRRSGATELYINGKLEASGTSTVDLDNSSCVLHIGDVPHVGNGYYGSLALFRISATAPSPEAIKRIYEDEKVLFQENAKAVLHGTSDAVTALAFDDTTNLLHVGTSAGRSVFQGLRRVDNTTTAVTSAISASNGLVADE